MTTVPIDILLAAAKRSLAAWGKQEERVLSEQADVIAALRNAVIAAETALAAPVLVDLHKGCGGVLGYSVTTLGSIATAKCAADLSTTTSA